MRATLTVIETFKQQQREAMKGDPNPMTQYFREKMLDTTIELLQSKIDTLKWVLGGEWPETAKGEKYVTH